MVSTGKGSPRNEDGAVLPLVILLSGGGVADLSLMNEKGFRKSREQGTLWAINGETGRLLPYREGTRFAELSFAGRWYVAILESADTLETDSLSSIEASASSAETDTVQTDGSDVLASLVRILKQRKAEMPEGSYTTYLFSQGSEKIRKKTGEEAIELILARERGEMIYESADLIYHMLVLLEAHGIDLNEIFAELKKRFG